MSWSRIAGEDANGYASPSASINRQPVASARAIPTPYSTPIPSMHDSLFALLDKGYPL